MNTQKYSWILYLIVTTIITTITVQIYWNFKNYAQNKQRVTNEIQLSLDNAVEEYYSSLAKSNFITIVESDYEENRKTTFKNSGIGKVLNKIKNNASKKDNPKVTINNLKFTSDENLSKEKIDSMMNSAKKFVTEFNLKFDSLKKKDTNSNMGKTQFDDKKNGYNLNSNGEKKTVKYFTGKKAADSLKTLINLEPIFISFLDQTVAYEKIDSLIENQLLKKGINLKTSFNHIKNDTLFHQSHDFILDDNTFSINSKSTFVRNNEAFKLLYSNPSFEALKRSVFGISLSLLLSLAIIASLFYLLKIIHQQKELAIVKNDLISNITHEFKTPIATVSTAIEALESFNVLEDTEKTKKYLAMSAVQLKKLHLMVEKLLETATLDSEQLILQREHIDLIEIIEKQVARHQFITKGKEILFYSNTKPLKVHIDVFHFENALSNLIDNAIKYGGSKIEINVNSILNSVDITVADNGNGIDKNLHEKVFEKFFRVPKGNTHDVKGFGIGLYYSKRIIEKHHGSLKLESTKTATIFKITLPNA